MEISGKVLREVEFRDRLRGYDTDEVDEFLEQVAVAVDELLGENLALRQRAERAERQLQETPALDDDGIRRTLVLAQRTADLAMREARAEAEQLLGEARARSEALLTDAEEQATRLRDEADRDVRQRAAQLNDQHDRLTREIRILGALLESERARISQSLTEALRFVSESMGVSEDVASALAARGDLATGEVPVASPGEARGPARSHEPREDVTDGGRPDAGHDGQLRLAEPAERQTAPASSPDTSPTPPPPAVGAVPPRPGPAFADPGAGEAAERADAPGRAAGARPLLSPPGRSRPGRAQRVMPARRPMPGGRRSVARRRPARAGRPAGRATATAPPRSTSATSRPSCSRTPGWRGTAARCGRTPPARLPPVRLPPAPPARRRVAADASRVTRTRRGRAGHAPAEGSSRSASRRLPRPTGWNPTAVGRPDRLRPGAERSRPPRRRPASRWGRRRSPRRSAPAARPAPGRCAPRR